MTNASVLTLQIMVPVVVLWRVSTEGVFFATTPNCVTPALGQWQMARCHQFGLTPPREREEARNPKKPSKKSSVPTVRSSTQTSGVATLSVGMMYG